RKTWSWWNLDSPVFFPSFLIGDNARGNIMSNGDPISIWALWKWQNRVVNVAAELSSKTEDEDSFPVIQRLSKTWIDIAARLTPKPANWDVWIARPFDLFSYVVCSLWAFSVGFL
ncbi:hypothetical protein Tco_0136532, partial [Tanacetum coccineum]